MADATNPLVGRSVGHEWAVFVATSGHFCWPPTGRNYWPLTLIKMVKNQPHRTLLRLLGNPLRHDQHCPSRLERKRHQTGDGSLLRLAGAVLIEQHDEWEAGDRRYFSEASMLELATMSAPTDTTEEVNLIPELTAAQAKTTDPHEDRELHHSAGRDRFEFSTCDRRTRLMWSQK
jgi:hypothetical protein